jgi:hypothetical protein
MAAASDGSARRKSRADDTADGVWRFFASLTFHVGHDHGQDSGAEVTMELAVMARWRDGLASSSSRTAIERTRCGTWASPRTSWNGSSRDGLDESGPWSARRLLSRRSERAGHPITDCRDGRGRAVSGGSPLTPPSPWRSGSVPSRCRYDCRSSRPVVSGTTPEPLASGAKRKPAVSQAGGAGAG